jgi:two-component system, sensor histidine kinase
VRLKIILNNLISNSIKFRKNGPSSFVQIKVRCKKDHVVILVKDNGVGIRKEYHKKVFDMFFKASSDGTGSRLGLYILRQALQKLNGRIRLSSTFGEGTEVTLTIPSNRFSVV